MIPDGEHTWIDAVFKEAEKDIVKHVGHILPPTGFKIIQDIRGSLPDLYDQIDSLAECLLPACTSTEDRDTLVKLALTEHILSSVERIIGPPPWVSDNNIIGVLGE